VRERERRRGEKKLLPPKETSEARTTHTLFSHFKREMIKDKEQGERRRRR
jgi:hypothetical protein